MDLEVKQKMITQKWCPPNLVLQRFNELVQKYNFTIVDTKGEFKKAREMRAAAIALLGFHLNDGHNYLILPAADAEQSPDVYTVYRTEHPVWSYYQTVEVVTFFGNTRMDIGQFLLDTKLANKKKAYDKDTIILCEIRKAGQINPSEIFKKFSQVKFEPTNVYMLGELPTPRNWQLTQLWPQLGFIKYDVTEQANNYPIKRPSIFHVGQSETFNDTYLPDMPPPDMYQMFDLVESKLNKKYSEQ